MTLHGVELRSGRVAVRFAAGDRTPVLLIHGNSANQDVFAAQTTMLRANGFGVLTLDLPGHGLSDNAKRPEQTYSFPGYAAVVAGVLDFLAIEHVHVAGWSLGGHVGLELMAGDPRVQSLLVWGTPPVKPGLEGMRAAFLPSPDMHYAGQAIMPREACARYGAAMIGAEGVPPALLDAIQRTDGQARAWMMRNSLDGQGSDARALVERDERPVAVLHGADDPFVNLAYLASVSYRNLWRGDVQVLPSIGHAAHWQRPALFNMLLLSFLLSPLEKASLDW